MTTNARIYVTVFLLLGMCVLMMAFAEWRLADPVRFACFFVLAVCASAIKVSAPAMAGRMPFNFIFVLLGLFELSLPETLLIGCASVLIECVWKRNGPSSVLEAYFSVANIAVAISVADRLFKAAQQYGSIPDWVLIGIATLVFFLFSTFPTAAIVALSNQTTLLGVWQAKHLSALPWYLAGAALAWAFHRAAAITGWQTALLSLPVIYLLYRTFRLHLARVEDKSVHAEEMANLHLRTIEALALAIEAKDDTTSDHLRRVQVYAVELGRDLGMKDEELEALKAAAILHDIGKLAVPEYIISKPGKLTPQEFEKMKVHPVVGAEILEHVQFPYPVVPIVQAHHEKWNGTGYPYGLKGTDIPLGARILSAVDALDALATDRHYRRALPLDEAMSRIEEESGRSFDPAVVERLKRRYIELERKAQGTKSSGLKLSIGGKFGQGAEPAAGFEHTRPIPHIDHPEGPKDLLGGIAQARQDVQALFETGVRSSDMEIEEICSVFALRLNRVVPFDAIAIYFVREETLVPAYVHGDNHNFFSSLQIPMGQGLSGWVAENKKPIVNGNPSVESGYLNNPSFFSTLRSALSLPLEGTNAVFGVISLYRDARDAFTRDHLRLMQALVPRLGLALEAAFYRGPRAEVPKTAGVILDGASLLNHLQAEIVRSKRLNMPLAILMCSVDGIRGLPAQHAEQALATLLNTIDHSRREFDMIARTGEREFVIVLPGLNEDILQERVVRIGKCPLPFPGASVVVGKASFPTDGLEAEELLVAADRRLFRCRNAAEAIPAVDGGAKTAASGWVQ